MINNINYSALASACLRALAIWSGHEEAFAPHLMPSRRLITSSTFMPTTSLVRPWLLPGQPPKVVADLIMPSSTSISMRLAQTPCGA